MFQCCLADEDAASGCKSDDVTGTGSFVARAMWRFGGVAHAGHVVSRPAIPHVGILFSCGCRV